MTDDREGCIPRPIKISIFQDCSHCFRHPRKNILRKDRARRRDTLGMEGCVWLGYTGEYLGEYPTPCDLRSKFGLNPKISISPTPTLFNKLTLTSCLPRFPFTTSLSSSALSQAAHATSDSAKTWTTNHLLGQARSDSLGVWPAEDHRCGALFGMLQRIFLTLIVVS